MRHRIKQITTLEQRLSAMIASWRDSIAAASEGDRDGLVRKIRSAEEAIRIQRWVDSNELKAPH